MRPRQQYHWIKISLILNMIMSKIWYLSKIEMRRRKESDKISIKTSKLKVKAWTKVKGTKAKWDTKAQWESESKS